MKLALATPFGGYLPLHPGAYLGYGTAAMAQKGEIDVFDFCAQAHHAHRARVAVFLQHIESGGVDPLLESVLHTGIAGAATAAYGEVPWPDYDAVFITQPAWAPTIQAESFLGLARAVLASAPGIRVSLFSASLGTWTDRQMVEAHGVNLVHLNGLFSDKSWQEPVDYDRLPIPVFPRFDHYIFRALPFRLKHGCSWGRCKFCSISKGANAGYLERSGQKAAEEVRTLVGQYRPELMICRDNAVNGENLIEFCDGIQDLGVPWLAAARADLTREQVRALARASCKLLYFGLESGSDKVLALLNKGVTTGQLAAFLELLKEEGIQPVPTVFVGAPQESDEDFEHTCNFVRRHHVAFEILNVYPYMASPGSDFSVEGKRAHEKTQQRLSRIIELCHEKHMQALLGISTLEYMVMRMLRPGPHNYDRQS